MSTESGLPDYRGEHGLYRERDPLKHVIKHSDYVGSEDLRKRYWARSLAGGERFSRARPNRTHLALAALERAGLVAHVVTQNVDRLHHEAGTVKVVELHGRGDRVHCVRCGWDAAREEYVARTRAANPGFYEALQALRAPARPDFDAAVPEEMLTAASLAAFALPACPACGHAVVKPSFVFFGGSVAPAVAEAAARALASAPLLLVVGTTVQTYSAFRPVSLARQTAGVSVGVVNRGATRVDSLVDLGFYTRGSCGDFFQELVGELGVSL